MEITPLTHDPACLAQQESIRLAQAEYDQTWPRHCGHCRGWGNVVYSENIGELGNTVYDENWYPCPRCYEIGICPRCGNIGWDLDHEEIGECPCRSCGWTEEAGGRPMWENLCACEEIAWRAERDGLTERIHDDIVHLLIDDIERRNDA